MIKHPNFFRILRVPVSLHIRKGHSSNFSVGSIGIENIFINEGCLKRGFIVIYSVKPKGIVLRYCRRTSTNPQKATVGSLTRSRRRNTRQNRRNKSLHIRKIVKK